MKKTEEADSFAEEGDLGGPKHFPSVIGAAVSFCVVHCLAEEAVQVFVCVFGC